MRNLLKTTTTVALIAGAALSLAACGKSETTTTNTTDNTSMTDMNAMTPMEGSTNDMSATDMNSMGNDMTDNSTNAM
jgi:ABC-type oligopeptide transport system substrate-binding subunit